ncbi:5'-AMP-activated protein kinase subunit gamma-1-like isoform X1 [Schistocerca gregaria]|uniref:5'-AMP-activated protein kinase subunit gamma-1-like isoform X1 n=1 Tax=Schistocerca gregaria TaxID=7010 RepID=UPI00211E6106|nr:5'-AMP-activated protein kinase subunit gamma-1-like isoform X1 [Schistocerca gregaria]
MEDSDLFQIEIASSNFDSTIPIYPESVSCAKKTNLDEQYTSAQSQPPHEDCTKNIDVQYQTLNSHPKPTTFSFQEDTNAASIREHKIRVSTLYTEDRMAISDFLRRHKCHSVTPQSSKIIILDTRISLRASFLALEENDTDSAILWDSTERHYAGLVTIGDLVSAILGQLPISIEHLHDEQLMEFMLGRLQSIVVHDIKPRHHLITVNSEFSIYDSCKALSQNKLHRIPIVAQEDENIMLYILNTTYIATFLMKSFKKKLAIFDALLECLNIGTTATNLVTCKGHSRFFEALKLLSEHQLSVIPIVDDDNRLLNVLHKRDLVSVPHADILKTLFQPTDKVIEKIGKIKKKYACCKSVETLGTILNRMVDHRIRSLIIIDNRNMVTGIVSLNDIYALFL